MSSLLVETEEEFLRRRHRSTGTDIPGAPGFQPPTSVFPFTKQTDELTPRTESETCLSRRQPTTVASDDKLTTNSDISSETRSQTKLVAGETDSETCFNLPITNERLNNRTYSLSHRLQPAVVNDRFNNRAYSLSQKPTPTRHRLEPSNSYNVYTTPSPPTMLSQLRTTSSHSTPPVGPAEFMELYYRSRTNSMSNRTRAYSAAATVKAAAVRAASSSAAATLTAAAEKLKTVADASSSTTTETNHLSAISADIETDRVNSNGNYSEFEPDKLVVWKDPHIGLKIFRLPRTVEEIPACVADIDNVHVCLSFLQTWTCYDVLPKKNKLVVFDTQLNLRQSFFALVYNAIRAVPLWDSEFQRFVGMLTVTDYVKLLLHYHKMQPFDMTVIEEDSISTWKDRQTLVYVRPDTTLQEAMNVVCRHKIHWLPVVEPSSGNILHILTYSHLLRHLYYIFKRNELHHPIFFTRKLEELKVGTYDNLTTIIAETPLHVALDVLVSRRLSAVPVVNKSGSLSFVFAKCDILELAARNGHNNLNVSVGSVMKKHRSKMKPATCHKSDTLYHVVEQIVTNQVQRLIVVNNSRKVIGVVSISDVIRCIVQQTKDSQVKINVNSQEKYGLK